MDASSLLRSASAGTLICYSIVWLIGFRELKQLESVITHLTWTGISTGLLIIAILLRLPVGDKKANRYLAGFVFTLLLFMMHQYYMGSGLVFSHPQFMFLLPPSNMLIGPMLYLYVFHITSRGLPPRVYPHFIPFAVTGLLVLPLVFRSEAENLDIVETYKAIAPFRGVIFDFNVYHGLYVVSFLSYAIACFRLLHTHKATIHNEFSSIEGKELWWLRVLALTLVLMAISLYLPIPWVQSRLLWTIAIATALIFYVGYSGTTQPVIFQAELNATNPLKTLTPTADENGKSNDNKKYSTSGIGKEQQEAYWLQLQHVMNTQETYLTAGLTLDDLAQQMGIHSNYISQSINSMSGEHFYDYINGLRINRAKDLLLQSDKKMNILDIALAVGFNSKSAFYAQFKKNVGITPREFKKRRLKLPVLTP